MNEEQLVLVKYRLKEAEDSIEEASVLLKQKGDYMEEAEVTKEDVDEIFPKAIDFVNKIREHLLGKQ